MVATKEIWAALSQPKKLEKISEALDQINAIEMNRHPLSKKFDQGRLAAVKKDLEKFVINALTWESDKQLQRHH